LVWFSFMAVILGRVFDGGHADAPPWARSGLLVCRRRGEFRARGSCETRIWGRNAALQYENAAWPKINRTSHPQ
jgi:hypothetical protein